MTLKGFQVTVSGNEFAAGAALVAEVVPAGRARAHRRVRQAGSGAWFYLFLLGVLPASAPLFVQGGYVPVLTRLPSDLHMEPGLTFVGTAGTDAF